MKSVYVFGDAILDHDTFVRPVGIVKSESMIAPCVDYCHDVYSLGGAGRVAAKLASRQKYRVAFFTCYGHSGLGRDFVRTAEEYGVRLGPLGQVQRKVSVKHRIWENSTNPRLLLRIDNDEIQQWKRFDSAYLEHEDLDDAACFVVVSHDKGCCTHEFKQTVVNHATTLHRIVLADPGKDDDFLSYGSPRTIFKLNAHQAQRAAAVKLPTPEVFDWETVQPEEVYFALAARIESVLKDVNCAGIWLTLGPGGMLYLSHGMEPIRVKHSSQESPVRDSCGAGDAAMAAFAEMIEEADLKDRQRMVNVLSFANSQALAACQCWRWLR